MTNTKIEWTDKTWNPITGCTKLSEGCKNCYAEKMAKRLKGMKVSKYVNEFSLTLHEEDILTPLKWKKSHTIFVCSMSDIFHEEVPFSFINKIMNTIENTPHHRYQILTKRAERMNEYFLRRSIPENIWLGVTVESSKVKDRIEHIRYLDASVKFLSCEPLIDNLGTLDLTGINWIIVGGESGTSARIMEPEWVRLIQNQANEQQVAFFFKQWGTWGSDGVKRNKTRNGKELDGKVIQMMPI